MKRKPMMGKPEFDLPVQDMQIMNEQVSREQREALHSLLISLIVVGVMVEAAVAILSYVLAETAIKPIRENYEAQKAFIANASHEIKTPLAAITANLEAAEIKDNHWIDNISREVGLLSHLNQELLDLARIDNADVTSPASARNDEVEVQGLFGKIAGSFEAKVQAKKISFKTKITPKAAKIIVNESDLYQILAILVDNAIKYGEKKASLEYANGIFEVKNDGATIPPERISQVFERFYQVDKSTEGVGLGLSIAKALAERNDWELELISSKMTTARLKM